jgi:subtilisin-like proprotein convertase family protein
MEFYDIRLASTPEAKSALQAIDQQIDLQREQRAAATLARRAREGRIIAERDASEIRDDMLRAESRLARRMRNLSVTRNHFLGSPEIVEIRGASFLTPPSTRKPESIVRAFVSQNAALYGLTRNEANQLSTDAVYTNPAGNLSWVVLSQHIDGIPVFQGEMVAALRPNGEIVRTVGNLASGLEIEGKTAQRSFARKSSVAQAVTTRISAAEAVARGAQSIGVTIDPASLIVKESSSDGTKVIFEPGPFAEAIKVELVYFPLKAGVANLSWSMVLWQDNPAYYTIVDAEGGELMWRKNITNDQTQTATFVVYDGDSPAPLSPTTALPGSGTQGAAIARTSFTFISELPAFDNLGWITDGGNTTTGNNVDAGLDLVSPNGIDAGTRPVGSPMRVFDFPYNPGPGIPPPGDAPTGTDYRNGEVVNMFFWSNRYHDLVYQLGFTEAARNFQQDNFGRGGLGNDFVRAEGQDFSGTNNANFATPADGSLPRMQMFIFTGTTPDRTSGLDQEILIHELTHGTSNRLHNNASGLGTTMSGGMGEGWSDFYALSLLSQPADDPNGIYAVGGYSTLEIVAGFTDNYYYGIRRFPHAVMTTVGANGNPHNPLTFADIDPAQINLTDGAFPRGPIGSSTAFQVHNIGEVWCAGLWEVRARIMGRLGNAAGNQRMLQIVTDGMKLDPINPTLLQGRDSIIAADCASFAGADEVDIWNGFAKRGMGVSAQAASSSSSTVVEAFDTPNLMVGTVTVSNDSCDNLGFADPGETVTLSVPLKNTFVCTSVTGVSATISGSGTQSYGSIAGGASVSRDFTFTVPSATPCGSPLTISIDITSSLGTITRTFDLQIGAPTSLTPAMTYSTGNIAVPIPDVSSVDIPVTVSDVGAVGDVNVRVRLNHTFDGDLVLSLIGPDGTTVALANNRGGSGDNFGSGANDCSGTPTVFDDAAATAISAGVAPFAATFRPDSPLSAFNGRQSMGTWKLRVADTASLDVGTVGCFQIEIRRQLFYCCGVPGTPIINAAPPATVTAESCTPANSAPDPDETVTMSFPLKNVGTGLTTDLVATLLPGGGVNTPSGPQSYGVLSPVGPAVSRPFTFVPSGMCGGTINATFHLQDGATDLGTVTFAIKIGATLTGVTAFSNAGAITIPNPPSTGASTGVPSAPYPSTISVSGITGTVTKVTATLNSFSHTFPSDVDVLLVGPGGQKLLLMSDVGGGTDAVGATLTFDDSAAAIGATVVSGTFRPTNSGTGDAFPAPAPAGPYPDPQLLSVFNGVDPNGTWSLFVVDDASLDIGSIAGGWSLTITTADPVCCASACVLTCPANITVSNDLNQCGAVVNYTVPPVSGSCGVVTSSPASGSFFPVGTTTVTVTATRQDGGTTTCTFTVTVNDTQPPVISCAPISAVAVAPTLGGCTTVTFTSPAATDNCSATVVCTPPSGSCFPLGVTTVVCVATDPAGNTSSTAINCPSGGGTITIQVFDNRLQDDSVSARSVVFNSVTGDYIFCCSGVTLTGTATRITRRGGDIQLEDNRADRRVLIKISRATFKGSASVTLFSGGGFQCQIEDRDTRNDTAICMGGGGT